ncbi:hypothetical protein Lser_V15G05718 [Lactuca serriola]
MSVPRSTLPSKIVVAFQDRHRIPVIYKIALSLLLLRHPLSLFLPLQHPLLLYNPSDAFSSSIPDDTADLYKVPDDTETAKFDEALATDVSQAPRESPKMRELFNEDFESESEEQVLEEDEYESDGVQIMEVCGEY